MAFDLKEMRRTAAVVASLGAALTAWLAPVEARAFCGFYVSGADTQLFNNATQVALVREGTRTVLSMQNNYQGPPEDFAMVVPVPVILQKENVRTLSHELFAHLDRLSAPRLVEYHEANPCAINDGYAYSFDDDPLTAGGFGPSDAVIRVRPGPVRVEARFAVGEYEVVMLSSSDAASLDEWLREHGYKIPAGAGPYLRPYVQEGMKFFVARVDSKRLERRGGVVTLSPLRFFYDSDSFRLPVRLGLINSAGKQDLIVHILARGQRYEAANYPNAVAPTNLIVAPEARASFGPFYSALFDRQLARLPGAVVTEYSWQASSCDPCPTPALDPEDLAALGADTLATPGAAGSSTLRPQDDPTWVLTRLHTRYDRRSLGDDLIFRAAPPIEGGRGVPSAVGTIDPGVRGAGQNTFQGRFVMLHPWTGEARCEAPRRGVWGAAPPLSALGLEPDPGPTFVKDPLSLVAGSAGLAGLGASVPRTRGGCAGCTVSPAGSSLSAFLLALLPLASALRRLRRG
jgi:hypothetical protein